jgi:hypothetical protein
MLKKIKNGGILALVLAAGMAVLQPASAAAAERHDRDYRGAVRVERTWNDRREYRDYRGWDRDHGRVYNYAPAPRYYSYPVYGTYPYCPR